MCEDRAAIKRDLDRREKGSDRAPMHLGQEKCAALPWAGRVPAALPVGPGSALGRTSQAPVGSQLSMGQPRI